MVQIKKESLTSMLKSVKVSYLGNTTQSAKMQYSYNNGVETYCVYLAPADMSGHNVCPNSKWCKAFCLNSSGHNKADILAHGEKFSKINMARIKKTKLFYENRDLFMRIMIAEIKKHQAHAKKNGLDFAIRINGTSDLSPEIFKLNGKNILEMFPEIQFYDYTKVANRIRLMDKYDNYDITLSFNGHNWNDCETFLQNGGKAAVVFEGELPKTFHGYEVIDANGYDMRYLDPKGTIMGLHYHPVANDYKNGKLHISNETKFIVRSNDKNCEW